MKIYNINKTIEEVKSELTRPIVCLNPFKAEDIERAATWMRDIESEFVYLYCKDTPFLIEIKDKFAGVKDEIVDYLFLNAVLVHSGE